MAAWAPGEAVPKRGRILRHPTRPCPTVVLRLPIRQRRGRLVGSARGAGSSWEPVVGRQEKGATGKVRRREEGRERSDADVSYDFSPFRGTWTRWIMSDGW